MIIHKVDKRKIEDVAEEHGIVGIVAILSKWSQDVGGLDFVKRAVASIDQETIDKRIIKE